MGVRHAEMRQIRKSVLLLALNRTLMDSSPIIVALATFALFSFAGHDLSADQAFTALALFNLLGHPFRVLPKSISLLSELKVTVGRLENFFQLKDKKVLLLVAAPPGKPTITVRGVSVGWQKGTPIRLESGKGQEDRKPNSSEFRVVVEGVAFQVKAGELLLVVSGVGQGKSTLLSALVGEGHVQGGTCTLAGRELGFVPQVPWIKNGTVRENILMCREYDDALFKKVVHACALEQDLEALPDGDLTVVGERGIMLSGGQKQRISLARALYMQADMYVLDCPLASLDSITAKHVFVTCVLEMMLGAGAAVVMASNSAWVLERATSVAVLQDGKCTVGTVQELKSAGEKSLLVVMCLSLRVPARA